MLRVIAAWAACGLLWVGAAACASATGSTEKPAVHPSARASPATEQPGSPAAERPQRGILMLPAGRSSAHYLIRAPSPARYGFDVTVSAPVSADVTVNALTWYGSTLGLLLSTRGGDSCQRHGAQDVCLEHFPVLPAQRAGTWTIVAAKRSGPAATVHIAIAFARA